MRVSDKTNVWPIAQNLASLGHKVSIVTYKGPFKSSPWETEQTTIHFLSSQENFISVQDFPEQALKQVAQIHKTHPIDHVHSIDTNLKKFKKAFHKKTPSLSYGAQASSMESMFSLFNPKSESSWELFKMTFVYPLYFLKKYLFSDYFSLKEAQGVFVNSPKQAVALERYYLYPRSWIFQVPLDTYINDLSLKQKNLKLLEELNISTDAPILATATKMLQHHDTVFLLDAFEKVALSHPKAKFLILGSGPAFKTIEKEVLLRALDSRVIFTKNIPSHLLRDYICLSDVFVNMNSQTSGFGATLIEAMAQQKVIIGSEFSPISHIIEHGKNGFLIRPGEVTKCANLIDEAFSGKIDANTLGQQARNDILKSLDKEQLTIKTLNAFKKINSRRSRLFSL